MFFSVVFVSLGSSHPAPPFAGLTNPGNSRFPSFCPRSLRSPFPPFLHAPSWVVNSLHIFDRLLPTRYPHRIPLSLLWGSAWILTDDAGNICRERREGSKKKKEQDQHQKPQLKAFLSYPMAACHDSNMDTCSGQVRTARPRGPDQTELRYVELGRGDKKQQICSVQPVVSITPGRAEKATGAPTPH